MTDRQNLRIVINCEETNGPDQFLGSKGHRLPMTRIAVHALTLDRILWNVQISLPISHRIDGACAGDLLRFSSAWFLRLLQHMQGTLDSLPSPGGRSGHNPKGKIP